MSVFKRGDRIKGYAVGFGSVEGNYLFTEGQDARITITEPAEFRGFEVWMKLHGQEHIASAKRIKEK